MSDPASFTTSLAEAADDAVGSGAVTRSAADAVLAELASRIADGTFLMLVTMFTVIGTKAA
jgi:hypothetical protein